MSSQQNKGDLQGNQPDGEYSESGVPIIRHQPRNSSNQPATADEESLGKITRHIEKHIGKPDLVWHEILSDLVHIDLHMVKPTPERNFYTLVTSGMSYRPMTTPPGAENYRFAEMLICLPSDWPMDQKRFGDENIYWPLRWLKMLARMPHEYKTWLGLFHTIPNGDPPEPFARDTRLCCAMISFSVLFSRDVSRLEIGAEKTIWFYSLVPLYREEMEFKLKHGSEPLVDRLMENNVTELLNPQRNNVCLE